MSAIEFANSLSTWEQVLFAILITIVIYGILSFVFSPITNRLDRIERAIRSLERVDAECFFDAYELDNPFVPPKPTNADRIRSMSDEELATEITKNPSIPCRMCEYYNHKLGHCDARRDFACVTAYAEALALDWLKQPVKEEHYEDD